MGADRPFRQWEDRAGREVGRVAFFSRLALGAKGLAEDVSKKEIPGQPAGYFGEIVRPGRDVLPAAIQCIRCRQGAPAEEELGSWMQTKGKSVSAANRQRRQALLCKNHLMAEPMTHLCMGSTKAGIAPGLMAESTLFDVGPAICRFGPSRQAHPLTISDGLAIGDPDGRRPQRRTSKGSPEPGRR